MNLEWILRNLINKLGASLENLQASDQSQRLLQTFGNFQSRSDCSTTKYYFTKHCTILITTDQQAGSARNTEQEKWGNGKRKT